MNQRLALLILLAFGLWLCPAAAQDSPAPASVYNVGNVEVDVTADSAAKARDQAIAQAQRAAFGQLLERFGAAASLGAKLSDNDLATLVQNFEVRNERASNIRYIGTFSVQFRPTATRAFLASRNVVFNDAQGRPVLVIPVVKNGDMATVLDDSTPWQKAWSEAAHDGGIVPIVIPASTPEDKVILTPLDIAGGKPGEAVKNLRDKYQTDQAVVAILNGAPDNPATWTFDLQFFGIIADNANIEHLKPPAGADKMTADALMAQAIHDIRHKIEKNWKEEKTPPTAAPAAAMPPQIWSNEEAPARLAVSVQFQSLQDWTDIQRRLADTQGVKRIDVSGLERSHADIELGFAGTFEDLQIALGQQNLRLTQDILSGQWMLKGF